MGLQNVKSFCKDNAATIFTVAGVIFTIGAVVEAVHATSKVHDKLEEAEYENWEELGCPEDENVDISLTPGEVIKLSWTNYIFTGVLVAGAVTFDILSLRYGKKEVAKYAGAYILAAQTVNTLRDSIRDNLSPRDARRIESDYVRRVIDADRQNPDVLADMQNKRKNCETGTIYRDAYSATGYGIYLNGTMDQFRKAVNLFNKRLSREPYIATINDWYDCLNLVGIDIGHSVMGDVLEFHWNEDGPMELYAVVETMDPDMDDNATAYIGLRRYESDTNTNQILAFPSTPRDAYGYTHYT